MSYTGKGFEVILAAPAEYDNVVAEIYFDGLFIGQLNCEEGEDSMELEFSDEKIVKTMICLRCPLDGFLEALEDARRGLTEPSPKSWDDRG